MRGGGARQAIRGAAIAARAVVEARGLVRRHAPRVVFSIGGYAAGPVALAARTLGISVALMEPNAEVGLANRLAAPFVQRAYTAFEESGAHFAREKVLRTGAPIRSGFRPVPYAREGELSVLVLGGSQGAESLNEAVPRALAACGVAVRIVHQCGAGKDVKVRALYVELGLAERAMVVPFIDDMPARLARSSLVVGRAGAGAVAEICAVGRPSLLIPYPFAGDHQRHNALALERAGASVCVLAAEATSERLAQELRRLATLEGALARMAERAARLGRPDAARVIALDLLRLAGLEGSRSEQPGSPGGSRRGDGSHQLAGGPARSGSLEVH
jgi:UDP-N-acetylglucosamine--N-acetylmuramyl-(pentapeptide) pyrophosphoryl-undecaprenol N-acetylglucosamine transferase